MAVREIRRLGEFGLSDSEPKRYSRYSVALLADSAQLTEMDDRIAHAEQLQQLTEAVACSHVFMAPATAQSATEAVLETIDVDDVNAVACDMCSHVLGFGDDKCALPSAAIVGAPLESAAPGADQLTEEARLAAVAAGVAAPIDSDAKGPAELPMPAALMDGAAVAAIVAAHAPVWRDGAWV